MKNTIFPGLYKDPGFILTLILFVFFLKGIFLVTLQPIFGGQDEARHYNTIQFFSEPTDKPSFSVSDRFDEASKDKDDLETYQFSEEIKKTATATNTDILRGEIYNTILFSRSSDGINETEINQRLWPAINYEEPDAVRSSPFYHKTASLIEKAFSGQSILVRFYLIRIFSVLLGTIAVFLCYFIAKTIGLSPKISLILTAILAFQPKFSLYFTNINYDVLLIPFFFLFTLAGVLTLKNGLTLKNITLLIGAVAIATQVKGTGYILVVVLTALIAFILFQKVQMHGKKFRYITYGASALIFFNVLLYLHERFLITGQSFGEISISVWEYIEKTITWSRFILPSPTYWGTLSWVRNPLLDNVTNLILIIETIAIIGLGILLFSKKFKESYPTFLPARKYVVFLIGMIVALQLGIRTIDWVVFTQVGGMKLSLGTPGRYFLPNLVSHILLVGIGLGALLTWFKKEKYFEPILLAILIGMMSLMMYLTFNVIILRFYF